MDATNPQFQSIPELRKTVRRQTEVACDNCGLFGMCEVAGLNPSPSPLLDHMVVRRDRVAKHADLFNSGAPFREIYAVKSGAFKTYTLQENGEEKIIDFHFPGELIGLESLHSGHQYYNARALENSSVCRLRIHQLTLVGELLPDFQQQLIEAFSRKVLHGQWMYMLVSSQSAEQRLAAFLICISSRFAEAGLPSADFRLPMARDDIANYLGLAVETISRMLKRFQAQGLLKASGRSISLRDLENLRQLARLEQPLPPTPVPV